MTFLPVVTYWVNRLGANESSLTKLSGGINNSVFSCYSNSRKWVIKVYPNEDIDQQDRMKAEVDFLRYAAIVAPGYTPKLIEIDKKLRCIVMEHITGDLYLSKVQRPCLDHLKLCASFIEKLNSNINLSHEMIHLDAAESFSALSGHILCIRKRFSSMNTQHIPSQLKEKASKMHGLLEKRINEVDIKLASQIDSCIINDPIRDCDKWVSPSDFGFHNAVFTSNKIMFIDFEFAGWDDPSKTILDFWMQPRIQVPNSWLTMILHSFTQQQIKYFLKRLNAAVDIFELKWATIILSILNPNRYTQMLSDSTEEEKMIFVLSRLKKASLYLGKWYSNEFRTIYPWKSDQ